MIIKGIIHRFGRDIDTDIIIPGQYLSIPEMEELAQHCMEGVDPLFTKRVKQGDLIFAEENFGCGSSREHAPLVLKEIGIACVVAKSFARIFYRNAINVGLAILECPMAVDCAKDGNQAIIDVYNGSISIGARNFVAQPFPAFLQDIIKMGGLMPYVKHTISVRGNKRVYV